MSTVHGEFSFDVAFDDGRKAKKCFCVQNLEKFVFECVGNFWVCGPCAFATFGLVDLKRVTARAQRFLFVPNDPDALREAICAQLGEKGNDGIVLPNADRHFLQLMFNVPRVEKDGHVRLGGHGSFLFIWVSGKQLTQLDVVMGAVKEEVGENFAFEHLGIFLHKKWV